MSAEYILTASGEGAAGTVRFRLTGEDLDGLVVTMRPRPPLRGRLAFDSRPPAGASSASVIVRLVPTDGGSQLTPVARLKDDWTFEIPDASGTGVLRASQLPRDWFLRAIVADGVDITDTPLDISTLQGKSVDVHLTQRATRITGSAADARSVRRTDYVAVVFPEDRTQWTGYTRTIAAARSDQQGRFTVQGLPPGRYLAAAVDYLEPGAERVPATLDRLRRTAVAIVLAEGESRTIDLPVVP